MAIVKCPECGNSVSNTTPQCIHCGCKFVCCPECGETFLSTAKLCTNCGYEFVEENRGDSESGLGALSMEWGKIKKKKKNLKAWLTFISIVLGFLPFVILSFWKHGDPFEALLRYDLVRNATIAMSIVSAVLYFICLCITKNNEHMSVIQMMSLIKRKNVDVKKMIMAYTDSYLMGKTVFQLWCERETVMDMLYASVYKENVSLNTRKKTFINIYCFLSFALYAAVEIFLVINIIGFMEHTLWETDSYFGFLDNIWILVIGFFIVMLRYILILTINQKLDGSVKTWIENNLPEYDKKLDDKIAGSKKYAP